MDKITEQDLYKIISELMLYTRSNYFMCHDVDKKHVLEVKRGFDCISTNQFYIEVRKYER